MNRAERRKNKWKKVRERMNLIKSLFYNIDDYIDSPGKLSNNNYVNNTAGNQKTNTRKAHSTYRTKRGGYGKATQWSPHDQRQIDNMKEQLEDHLENQNNVDSRDM